MPKSFLVSDESINTYRCRVLSSGGDTTAFESNPVMLYMHQRGNVIGRWENVRLEKGAWFADPVFDTDDNGLGRDIGGKVGRGFLKAASIGIQILEAAYNELLECYDIIRWVLQEISIVDVGANANALQFYNQAGEPLDQLQLASQLATFKPTTDQPTPKPMELKTMALAMGLPETATEKEVETAALKLSAEAGYKEKFEQLQTTLAAAKVSDATTLVDGAIADKRISADTKDNYLKLFAADFDAAKGILEKLTKPVDLKQFAMQGAANVVEETDEDAKKKYHDMDKAGTLGKLQASNPAEFSRLFEATFGKKPDKVQA